MSRELSRWGKSQYPSLPTQEFHANCVGSWLTKWNTFCPICKYDLKTELHILSSKAEVEIVTVDVDAAKDLIFSGNHRYLDVRTEEEFKEGHVGVENAFNIPYMFNTPEGRVKNPKFVEQVLSAFNKDDNIVVGCQSGVRSVYATTDLLKAEFKHVYNMGGGYVAWVGSGFAVKIPKTQEKENGFETEADTKTEL